MDQDGSHRVHGLVGEIDPTDVASPDDLAARRAEEFLAVARARQVARAAGPRPQPGVCLWCGQTSLLSTIYCDDECRNDHETSEARRLRQGGAAA